MLSIEKFQNYKTIVGHDRELLGKPLVIYHEEPSRNPRNQELPMLEELTGSGYYETHLFDKNVSSLLEDVKNRGRISGVVSSPVIISSRDHNVFIFPVTDAAYLHAVQFLGHRIRGACSIIGAEANKYDPKQGVSLDEVYTEPKGIAQVFAFYQPWDLRDYFSTPPEINKFDGSVHPENKLATRIFDELFKEKVNEIAKNVKKTKNISVGGVLLSDIKPRYHWADNILTVAPNPQGLILLGATYLV